MISWYKGDVPVVQSERVNMSVSGRVEISELQKQDSGIYTCVASSKYGKATWSGHLLVENPKNPNINFFKAPDAVMLPGPPSKPHALNQSEGINHAKTRDRNLDFGQETSFDYNFDFGNKLAKVAA